MTVNPFRIEKGLETRYLQYLKTLFPISNQEIKSSFNEQLASGEFIRGPFIEITPPYEKGATLQSLINEGTLSKCFTNFPEGIFPVTLHYHQSEALKKVILENKNIVVASGTGSGKTESFLIPIFNSIFSEIVNGQIEDGVRALILYPMNALVNDQLDRFRKILKHCPTVTFGRYTGETKETRSEGLAQYKRIHGNSAEPLPNERICRDDMREHPPHILLTNYAMLEYLLLRPDDNVFFSGEHAKFWKYIVIDEAHIYSGAKGLEISMLLRRLKDQIVQSHEGKITCIATSATLGSESSKSEVAKFAQQLFNEPFSEESIVSAKRITYDELESWETIPDPTFYHNIVQLFDNNSFEEEISFEKCIALAKSGNVDLAAISLALEKAKTPKEFIYYILLRDPRLNQLKIALKEGSNSLKAVGEFIFNNATECQEQLITLVDAASIHYSDELFPLLSARYHIFLKAAEGAYLSLFPNQKVHLKPLKSTLVNLTDKNETIDSAAAFEFGTCKYCGNVFFIGKIEKTGTVKLFLQNITPESEIGKPQKNLYLSFSQDIIEDPENEDEFTQLQLNKSYSLTPYKLCGICGRLSQKGAINDHCKHNQKYDIDVFAITSNSSSGDLHKCPICSKVSPNSPVIMRFLTGKDAVPAVLATELYQQLPDMEFLCEKKPELHEDCLKRNLLVFSDSRQDAAFFAPAFERSYQKINRRRMICSIIEKNSSNIKENSWDISTFIRYLIQYSNRTNLFCCEGKKNQAIEDEIKKWLMYEIIPRGDKGALEILGLLCYVPEFYPQYKIPEVLLSEPWNLSNEEGLLLCKIFIDQFRTKGALCYPDGVDAYDDFFSPVNREYYFKEKGKIEERGKVSKNVFSWIPSQKEKSGFYPNSRTDILKKLADAKNITISDDIIIQTLTAIWNSFRGYLVDQKSGKYQINPEMWKITSSLLDDDSVQWYYCDKCGELTLFNISNICPEYRCTGKLQPCDPTSRFEENHYYRLYREFIPVRMIAKEHTAQLTQEAAAKVQEDFVKGKINLISSSTTFELGVNVGELESVFMRNLPPNPANYVQRAGRAGRKTGTAAVAVTFCQRRPHDLSFYQKTDNFVNGIIKPPRIDVMNKKIVMRHLFSVICAAFWKQYPSTFKTVGAFFFDENEGKIDAIEKFSEFLESNELSLQLALERISPDGLFEKDFFEKWVIASQLISEDPSPEFGRLSKVAAGIREDIRLLEERRQELRNENDDRGAARITGVIDTLKGRPTIEHLSSHNILPKYGFPVDVVSLEILYRANIAKNLDLSRDLSIALSEYAPGSKVVAGGKVWESRYIKKNPKTNAIIKKVYSICKTCNIYQSEILETNPDLSICPSCNTRISPNHMGIIYMPRYGFVASIDPPHDIGEFRPEKTHSTMVYYSGKKDDPYPEHNITTYINDLAVSGWAAPNGQLALVNNAHNQGFAICSICGYSVVHKGKLPEKHKNSAGRECNGKLGFLHPELKHRYHLGHEFLTDICYLSFPGVIDGDDFWNSLLYSILEGASTALDIERTDINGCLYTGDNGFQSKSLILYDEVPGGAGLVKRIVETPDILKSVFFAAYNRLNECTCGGEDGDGSCYSCLRNFGNQYCHEQLNRGKVLKFFNKYGFK